MTFEEVSLSFFLVPSFPTLWFATHFAGSHFVFKWRCKDRQKGNAHGRKSLLSSDWGMKRNEKEWKRKESRKIGGWTLTNLCFSVFIEEKSFFRSDFLSYRGKWAEKRGICAENRENFAEICGIYSATTIKKKDYWFIALFIALFQLSFLVLYNSCSFRIFHRELLKDLS